MSAPVSPTRLDTAMAHVQRLIQTQRLPAGAPLPSEGQLSRDLGISRGMVREAYRALAATGAVSLSNGRAPRVGHLNADPVTLMLRHALSTGQVSVQHALSLRRALDTEAARLAALHRSEPQAQALVQAAEQLRSSPDLLRDDLHFHALIAESSGNPLFVLLARTFSDLAGQSIAHGRHHYVDTFHTDAFVDAHRQVARAIADRQPDRAALALHRHYEQAELATLL
ncbi:FadR/GntR family transcriptional regulator [Deinococcus sedimenti]|uniref:GntR family transcriptional regulator n=1 Tax=Deinococcus sedimenti TaxID=1867090 RepID=A0ABQ2S3Q7_9DEIO|nr:FCD domain-containing protein [Deinococcus sedimenti]GGR93484.1 GntR family transcriptional regulator [Deinococcus sedimenti]